MNQNDTAFDSRTDLPATGAGTVGTVQLPGNAALTCTEPFERETTQTFFTADGAPIRWGQTGEYLLQPVPAGITVDYQKEQ